MVRFESKRFTLNSVTIKTKTQNLHMSLIEGPELPSFLPIEHHRADGARKMPRTCKAEFLEEARGLPPWSEPPDRSPEETLQEVCRSYVFALFRRSDGSRGAISYIFTNFGPPPDHPRTTRGPPADHRRTTGPWVGTTGT